MRLQRGCLRDSLDGVLQQSLWEFEFVIVDDGSDDQTPEILAAYAKSDPRIRILRQENAGVAAALARGCGAARGDLIARIDADDIPLPERFERQMAFMESRPDVGVLGTGVEVDRRAAACALASDRPVDTQQRVGSCCSDLRYTIRR